MAQEFDYDQPIEDALFEVAIGSENPGMQLSATPAQDDRENEVPPSSGSGSFTLLKGDLEGLRDLLDGISQDDSSDAGGVRDVSGYGNNRDNPEYGSADQHFLRLTQARYGAYNAADNNLDVNPIFKGLDPRAISNVLGTHEVDLQPNAKNANIFFMAFGQYFDHGLDFLPKGGNGTVTIGGQDVGRPSGNNPADLSRGTVAGFDESGIPQHINQTSPFVDQNQAYGSHNLVSQFLRESDGHQGFGAHLLSGAADPSNPQFRLLPTLREAIQHHWDNNTIFRDPSLPNGVISFRDYYSNYIISEGVTGTLIDSEGGFDPQVLSKVVSNFMGSGHPLLLDTNPYITVLDHYVAGDGRANENVTLTSMHTIWARNHNFHVENLKGAGFVGTDEEIFQAAKIINEAEYQRVVFDEFADYLIGGIRGSGSHGHSEYNPDVNAGISHEFAAAVYRVGHSLIGQNITILDEAGRPKQVPLFDAFLNPTNDAEAFNGPLPPGYVPQPGFEQLGVDSILGGIITQPAEEVDFNIVDAVRNDLVRISADLFAFNVARGRDVGLGTLNQIRADLKASLDPYVREAVGFAGNLDPYASWEDFQVRNGLSNTVIAQFKQAYPDLVLQTQAEVDTFRAANPDIELVNGNTVKGIDRVDLWVGGLAEKHINNGMVGQTFWVVLHEQFDRLQEGDRFYYLDRLDDFAFYENIIDGQEFSDIVARNTGLKNLPEHIFEVSDRDGADDGNDDDEVAEGETDEDPVGNDDDENSGGDDHEDSRNSGPDGDDHGGKDPHESDPGSSYPPPDVPASLNKVTWGGRGHDRLNGGEGHDKIYGREGHDRLTGKEGHDLLCGEAGNDVMIGGAGRDRMEGGRGNDTFYVDHAKDKVVEKAGQGTDKVVSSVSLSLGSHVENLTLDGSRGIKGTGNNLDNVLKGNSGDNVLSGKSGDDHLHGGGGNDVLVGGQGQDWMTGGSGRDTFIFESLKGRDHVADFRDGVDKIDVSRLANVDKLADLSIVQAGKDALVCHNSDILVLEGVAAGDLDSSDFIF